MKLGLALAPMFAASFAASTAYAQAPGDYSPDYDDANGAPGMSAPVVVAPTPPPPAPRRWSIGLGVGSLNLAPHNAPDNETHYSVGQLAVRYLATRHLEIELAFAGGQEKYDDGSQGDHEVNQGVLGLRYRFNPGRPWNVWLMAGMGTLAVTRTEASKQERDVAGQSTLQFGAGIEKRWERFALQLELRAVGVKAHDADKMSAPVAGGGPVLVPEGSMQPPLPPEPVPPPNAGDGKAGGQIVFSGNYYF